VGVNDEDMLRILIVDGDGFARKRLRALLGVIEPDATVEEAESAAQAVRLLADIRPHLVLLDIDLPGVEAIERLSGTNAPCLIVMTSRPGDTLPDLELEAVDCLVKPVQRERFALGMRRARRRLAERRIAALALEIAGAAAAIGRESHAGPVGSGARYPDQLTIRIRRRMFALPVADIVWIEGASQYSRVHAKGGEYLLSRSLSSLEYELNPSHFFRIHRSAIVNAAYVREVMSRGDGRYNVYLQGGRALPMGRARREILDLLLANIGRHRTVAPESVGQLREA
jgi:two-component system LytT family response regulator